MNTEELDFDEENQEETPEEKKEEPEEPQIDVEKLEIETRGVGEVDYGEDIDPDDVKVISTVVEKQTQAIKDKLELDTFVNDNPQFSKYRPAIQKYMNHPKYKEIPLRFIAAGLASNELLKEGARREREAQAKADSTKTGGSPARKPAAGQTDWTRASKDEFEEHKRKVLGQRM
jgi:hypothetical protein